MNDRTFDSTADIPVTFGFFCNLIMYIRRNILDYSSFTILQLDFSIAFFIDYQFFICRRAVLMRYRVLEGTAEWFIYILLPVTLSCVSYSVRFTVKSNALSE